jgi:hypothetical protein
MPRSKPSVKIKIQETKIQQKTAEMFGSCDLVLDYYL